MATADKSRFNRRRMYLISNEFTLPAFSGARPLLIAEGFISLKRDLRELNIAEIPVEPRVRSNLIPGRASRGAHGSPPDSLLSLSPLISHYPQQLLVFIFHIRLLPYVHVFGRAENEATEEMSRRAWRFSRILKRYQLFVPGAAQLANGSSAGPRYVKIQPRSLSKTRCRRWWCSRSVIQSADGIPMAVCPAANHIDRSKRILLLGRINCLLC